jgi:hypothetical protein
MEGSALIIAGACLVILALAWKARRTQRALEAERHLMHELYDAVVAMDDADAPERLLRIRALRVLVTSLAGGELRLGLLAALDIQENELPRPDATIEQAIDVLLESVVAKIAKRELGTRADETSLPDTASLISRFVREFIRDWRALSGPQFSSNDAELRRRAEEMAQLELLYRDPSMPRFPPTPMFISRIIRELIRDWRALKDVPR